MAPRFLLSLLAVVAIGFSSTASYASHDVEPAKPTAKRTALTSGSTLRPTAKRTKASATNVTIKRGRRVGYVLELVVSCFDKQNATWASGVIKYSIIDKSFCSTNRTCYLNARTAARDVCRSSVYQDAMWSKH